MMQGFLQGPTMVTRGWSRVVRGPVRANTSTAHRSAGCRVRAGSVESLRSDGFQLTSDDAQLVADLAAHEDQGNDRNDRDEGENKSVFSKALAVDLTDPVDDGDQTRMRSHLDTPPFHEAH